MVAQILVIPVTFRGNMNPDMVLVNGLSLDVIMAPVCIAVYSDLHGPNDMAPLSVVEPQT